MVNESLSAYSPVELIVMTLVTVYCLRYLHDKYTYVRKTGVVVIIFRFLTSLPYLKQIKEKEKEKATKESEEHLRHQRAGGNAIAKLPEVGLPEAEIKKRVELGELQTKKVHQKMHCSGTVYCGDDKHWDFVSDVMRRFVTSNPLHMDEFAMVGQMEAEVIRIIANLYHGDSKTCGLISSGGTESILLACLAYREKARIERGVTKPNMVMSNSAHAAFNKACFYFNIEMRKVPVRSDCTCDLNALKAQIDSNTIMLVASNPDFPFGNYDPTPSIAALAKKWGIGCHSDCCLGGFVNPFVEESGYKLPTQYDFSVDGVTSISVDPHKYAMGPKGVSCLLFKDAKLRQYQMFAVSNWNGGFYSTPSIAGSRPGNVVAATWATLMKFGRKGYIKSTKEILDAAAGLRKAIREEMPEVQLASHSDSSVVAIVQRPEKGSINPISLTDLLKKRDWWLSAIQKPSGCHISFTRATAKDWRNLAKNLKECIAMIKADPSLNSKSTAATYGMTAKIPDSSLVDDIVKGYIGSVLDVL